MAVFADRVAPMRLNTVTVNSDSNNVSEFPPAQLILIAHFNS